MNPTQRLHLHLRAKINGHIFDQPYDIISLIVALANRRAFCMRMRESAERQ